MTADELRREVEKLRWHHRMELPGGVVTPGVVDTARALSRLGLPPSLSGRTVLDVGAWDGFYSFEAARRGAKRVLATDSFCWSGDGWGTKDGFLLARDALGLPVEDLDVDVMDLSPERLGGRFDVVLFLGVLYHLRDPVTALERVAEVTANLLVLETETSLAWLRQPTATIYAGRELNDDPTNWWALNPTALRALLARVGFSRVDAIWRTSIPRRAARAARERWRGEPVRRSFRSQRIVLHAWR
ncbi:MAG: class I SAM-dependent methyltransferase [Acidimicrobiales bacterium]|nr:DUF1698 domain-containing protein [Actinomycetota bacterium]